MKFKSAEIYRAENGFMLIAQAHDRIRDPRIQGLPVVIKEYCFGTAAALAEFIVKNIEEPDDLKQSLEENKGSESVLT